MPHANELPPLCLYGATLKTRRAELFRSLKAIWKQKEEERRKNEGNSEKVADRVLCIELQRVYNVDGIEHVNAQRISQWATGTDPAALCPDHILAYMLHKLKLVIVWSPRGFSLHEDLEAT